MSQLRAIHIQPNTGGKLMAREKLFDARVNPRPSAQRRLAALIEQPVNSGPNSSLASGKIPRTYTGPIPFAAENRVVIDARIDARDRFNQRAWEDAEPFCSPRRRLTMGCDEAIGCIALSPLHNIRRRSC
jgi:hypothetical protein